MPATPGGSQVAALAATLILGAALLGAVEPAIVFGVAALAIVVASALFSPTALVAIYAVVVVTNAADVATTFHGAPPIGGLMVPGLLILLLLRRAAGLEDLTTAAYLLVPAGVYLAFNSLSLIWIEDPSPTMSRVSDLLKNLVIFVTLCGFVTTRERFRAVLYAVGASAVGLAAISVFQYVTGTFDSTYLGFSTASVKTIFGAVDSWRLQGPVEDPNFYGQLLVMALPVVVAMIFAARSGLLWWVAVVGVPLVVWTIFLTYSRGAVAALVGLAILTILLSRHRVPIVLGGLAAAIVAFLVVPEAFAARLAPIFGAMDSMLKGSQAISDPALAQRINVIRAGISMFENNPFFGIGAGQFQDNYAGYALANGLDVGAPSKAHNSYLELAAEQGLVGVLVYFSMIASILGVGFAAVGKFRRSGYKTEAGLVFGLVLGVAGYLMTAIFLHDDYTRVFWLFASLLVSAYAISLRVGEVGHR